MRKERGRDDGLGEGLGVVADMGEELGAFNFDFETAAAAGEGNDNSNGGGGKDDPGFLRTRAVETFEGGEDQRPRTRMIENRGRGRTASVKMCGIVC